MLETAEPGQTREVFVLRCVKLQWRKCESLVMTRARWKQKSNAARLLVTRHGEAEREEPTALDDGIPLMKSLELMKGCILFNA